MIKSMVAKIAAWINKHITVLLPIITLLCAFALAASYVFPNKVLDTYVFNMEEENGIEESILMLEAESIVSFQINTGSRPLRGIQVGIHKNGGVFENGMLFTQVYDSGRTTLLSENRYEIKDGLDLQYVYLPFDNYESCVGDITIEFSYDAQGNTADEMPGLMINTATLEEKETYLDGEMLQGNLKGYLIYTHNTYPLTYDLKLCLFLLLAMTMTVNITSVIKRKRDMEHEAS